MGELLPDGRDAQGVRDQHEQGWVAVLMATIKATLQNLKNNGWTYYPVLVGGKLHINRDENKNTGVVYVLGELIWHEKKVISQIIEVWRPWYRVDWQTWEVTHHRAYKTLLPLKGL